jgi:hypothetical protein
MPRLAPPLIAPLIARLIAITAVLPLAHAARADEPRGLLETVHRHATLASTVTDNGDLNPYAIAVVPESVGRLQKGDVLVDNFNNISNLQGTGGTIVAYSPATRKTTLFAKVAQQLPQCPGGVGLTTAMAVLKSGWVIVGSTPSTDGTTRTRGDGCLLVFNADGQLVTAWSGPKISGPWGNMAVVDGGTTATLFVSMAGFDVPGPEVRDPQTGFPVTLTKATVLRLTLSIPPGMPPAITGQTVVADGLGHRADKDAFLIGPTGLALGADGTLYVADTLANRIVAINDATTRATSGGTGRVVTTGQLLQRPLALAMTPQGHLLTCNGRNGQVVEIDPASGRQLYAQWVDANQAQSPPGNGDLFGIAMRPDGRGFYYVEDEMNFLMEASP